MVKVLLKQTRDAMFGSQANITTPIVYFIIKAANNPIKSLLNKILFTFHLFLVPNLKKRKSDYFDITERVELGRMASMYFSKGKKAYFQPSTDNDINNLRFL